MTTPVIEFREVTKVYRKRFRGVEVAALTNATFSVFPGEVCAFLGPNGAGKTTSISMLMTWTRISAWHTLTYPPVSQLKTRLKPRKKAPSGPRDCFFGRRRSAESAGLSVRALKAEMMTDTAIVTANCW